MEMLGWELSRNDAALTPDEIEQIINLGTQKARLTIDCNKTALDASMKIQSASGLMLAEERSNGDRSRTRYSYASRKILCRCGNYD